MAVPEKNRDRHADLSLRAELANIEQLIAKLDTNDKLAAGEKLKWKTYYENERKRLHLKLDLPRLRSALKFANAKYEFACSPMGKKKAHRYAMMILAGRALGAGQGRMDWTDIPEDIHEKQAKQDLNAAEHAVDTAVRRIRYLRRRNAALKRAVMNPQPIGELKSQVSEQAKRVSRHRGHRQPPEVVESASEKYNNPKKFPWMTTQEVSAFLDVSTKRIYGLTDEGKLNGKKGRISTISVRKFVKNQIT